MFVLFITHQKEVSSMGKTGKVENRELSRALRKFSILNFGNVSVRKDGNGNYAVICFESPNKLKYPKGWKYSKGFFGKENPTVNDNELEAIMLLPNMHCWNEWV